VERKIIVQMAGALLRWSSLGRFGTRTVRKEVRKIVEGLETAEEARAGAIARAKRAVLEEVAGYLERQGHAEADAGADAGEDALALSSGLVQAELVKDKRRRSRQGESVRIVVKGRLSTLGLTGRVRRLLGDRLQLERLKATQRRNTALLSEYAALEAENRSLGDAPGPAAQRRVRKGFEDTARKLAAQEWLDKVQAMWNGVEYRDAKTAIDYINEAIALVPDYPIYYFYRGNANYYYRQHAPAIADYTRAIELDGRFAEAFNNRGNVHYRLEDYPRAIADYDQAVRAKPDYADAINNRANARYQQQAHAEALADYERALALDPESALYHNNRAITREAAGDAEGALEDYARAIALDPGLAVAFCNRGRLHATLGDPRAAIADFNRALRQNGRHAESYFERGNAYRTLGNAGAARRDWKKAARLGHPEAGRRAGKG
jgi:tetratricopeptide (TPR) repeat protein